METNYLLIICIFLGVTMVFGAIKLIIDAKNHKSHRNEFVKVWGSIRKLDKKVDDKFEIVTGYFESIMNKLDE